MKITVLVITFFIASCSFSEEHAPWELFLAISLGKLDDSLRIVKALDNVNFLSPLGDTPLAAASRDLPEPELIRLLVQKGADPNVYDRRGFTVLERVYFSENHELALWLMTKGARVDVPIADKHFPVSHYFTRYAKNSDELTIFMSAGGDVCSKNYLETRYTIHEAVTYENKEIYKELLNFIERCDWDVDQIVRQLGSIKDGYFIKLLVEKTKVHMSNNLVSVFRHRSNHEILKLLKKSHNVNANLRDGRNYFTYLAVVNRCDLLVELKRSNLNICAKDSKGDSVATVMSECSLPKTICD